MNILKFSVLIISLSSAIGAFNVAADTLPATNDTNKGKSANEQVVEYLKLANTVQDTVIIKSLTTNTYEGKADFSFIRLSKYNGYVICEQVSGNLSYHFRQSGNERIIQVDKFKSESISCLK
ncbi:hypothetical protein FH968_23455 [Buttiauxella sp. B2]|uniref:hypothetical protein n=1 Tax=Buttiauxella sp. B2 TaxID=2587812 RepID=UPI00111FA611|nr:hypothetical protein [Buttiauxella sp. B2]TNV09124.1 hypothetical protein FH968_23455 [Buttiauxella sp. B2]